jgi:DNA-directed RNA polymerase specialized sigma24 family protein
MLRRLVERPDLRLDVASLGRLGNVADAEDAVQDALLPALTHVDQFKGRGQIVYLAHNDRH